VIGRDEAAAIVDTMDGLEAQFGMVGMSEATLGTLDWAAGNGIIDLILLPRMPDGFPECEDQPG
jgi:hypothetical protein